MGFFFGRSRKPSMPFPLDEAVYGEMLVTELRKRGGEWRWDDAKSELVQTGGARWNLSNATREYNAADGDEGRRKRFDQFVRALSGEGGGVSDDWDVAAGRLRLQVQRRALVEDPRVVASGGIPYEALGDHTVLTLAYDLPDSLAIVMQHHLDRWGVDYWKAASRAVRNVPGFAIATILRRGPISTLNGTDNYAAARFLTAPGAFKVETKGAPIVCVVDRDTVVIVGSEEEEGMVAFAIHLAGTMVRDAARPLGGEPLVLRDGRWVRWEPPPGSPLAAVRDANELHWLAIEYGQSRESLVAAHEEAGTDVFVPNIFVANRDASEGESKAPADTLAIWSLGLTSDLPRVKHLQVVDIAAPDDAFRVTWEDAHAICGKLLAPQPVYPPRWRTVDEPSAAQLKALRAVAVAE